MFMPLPLEHHWRPRLALAELARSGECQRVAEIRKRLSAEGYSDAPKQLSSPMLKRDLQRLCRAAQGAKSGGERKLCPVR